jgi:NADH-quinone oxidoreductase subunit I
MTNEFELADDSRDKLIYEKQDLLAPLLPGMEEPPHERRLGDSEQAYFLGLPETGHADERAGSLRGAQRRTVNQGFVYSRKHPGREETGKT